MTNLSRKIRLGNKGQAMVEMAFVIFFLVILVFAITEFGRAMYTKNTLTNAARAGVRAAVVTSGITSVSLTKGSLDSNCSYTCPNSTNPEQCVYLAVCNGIVTNSLKSSVSISSSGVPAKAGDTVTITLQADFPSVVPRLFGPSGLIPFFPNSLTGTASMRQEQ